MMLRALELKRFGKFIERTFEFRHGMNLIAGPNESGKTTLMEAIPAVLFGLDDKARFKSRSGDDDCAAALVFEDRDRLVRIERNILTDRVLLTEHDNRHREISRFAGVVAPECRSFSPEWNEYREQLDRLFGIAEADLFRASLFVGQGTLDVSGRTAMPAGIRRLLFGFGEVDCDAVLKSFDADLAAITRFIPWGEERSGGRELEDLSERIAALENRCRKAWEALEELEPLRCEMAVLDKSIRIDRDEYAKGERYLAWARKQWQLAEEVIDPPDNSAVTNHQTARTEELEKQRRDIEKELARTGLPREIPEDLVKILVAVDEERKELVALQGESAVLRGKLLRHKAPSWKGPAGLSVLLSLAGGAIGWAFTERVGQALPGAGLLIAMIWIIYLSRAGKARTERARIQDQAQALEHQREEIQGRLAALDERFEQLGMSPSGVEIVKMQRNLANHQVLLERLKKLEIGPQVLDGDRELQSREENPIPPAAARDDWAEPAKKSRPRGLLPVEELPDAEEKLQALGEDLREREQRLFELTRREAELSAAVGDLPRIEEEREHLKERERALRYRRDTLITAFELLSGSVEEYRRAHLEQFSGEIGAYLAAATGGRYVRARFDENFSLLLQGKEDGQWQAVAGLSRGTVDAVGFGLRLALTRCLFHGRRLPLLLDDPLVNFDADRLAETLVVLERLAREHQIILSTHNEGLLKRAGQKRWNVVSLDDAKVSRNRANEERKDDVGQLHLL